MNYHKTEGKKTAFIVNRAQRSIQSSARLVIGRLLDLVLEITALSGILLIQCGSIYFFNFAATMGLYYVFTQKVTKSRRFILRERAHREQQAELYLNESVQHCESIKYFNNEEIESKRYGNRIGKLEEVLTRQMFTLGTLNLGQ